MAKKLEICENQSYKDNKLLNEIIYNSYDAIFVSDPAGTILLVNQASSKHLGLPVAELIGSNISDLLKKGYYAPSTALEAADKKTTVTGIVKSWNGQNVMATSTPLLDEEGNVIIVITNSRDKDYIEKYMIELERQRKKADRYKNEIEHLRHKYWKNEDNNLIAQSTLMKEVLLKACRVAPTDSTIMIYGQTGTGKEVIAQYIHLNSNRNKGPFITVNCAAIPENLIESELFGYEKGAFTGASTKGKPGLFEIADKGTIFLDEIAEMSLLIQSKLLRVLENSEIRRVGDTVTRRINVRIIGATNKNLKEMVARNEFRDDLYYRLNVIPIKIASLRERPEDILALANKFLEEFNKKYNFKKRFTRSITNEFLNYSWPGNVRELRNVVERLVIINPGDEIDEAVAAKLLLDTPLTPEEHISDYEHNHNQQPSAFITGSSLKAATAQFQEQYIKQVLAECNNSVGVAAEKLGIHRTGLYKKMNKKPNRETESKQYVEK